MNRSESQHLIGMAGLLADENFEDLDELEESVRRGSEAVKKNKIKDFAKEYEKQIDRVHKNFGPKTDHNNDELDADGGDDIFNFGGGSEKKKDVAGPLAGLNIPDDDDFPAVTSRKLSTAPPMHESWSAENPRDPYLANLTNEERKQNHINRVLSNFHDGDNGEDRDLIQQEEEEDEMARMMERADMLRASLEDQGIDIARIPEITPSMPKKEAKQILRILQIKNDRTRYSDMFEDCLLVVAGGLERAFNGKREWFGHKPDLVGWSDTVKVKLRRLRPDTSTLVSDMMKGYNINSGWRIILELLPSIFLYSKQRKSKARDDLRSDEAYKSALHDMQN